MLRFTRAAVSLYLENILRTITGFLLSALFQNYFLCWDHGNGAVPPTLDAALLSSSRAGSGLGLEYRLVEELYIGQNL